MTEIAQASTLTATEAAIAGLELCRTGTEDVSAIGAQLYTLASGLPLTQLSGSRPALHEVRPDLPEVFVTVVERALADDPAERYPSVGMLEAALSRAALATREEITGPEPSWNPLPAAATVLLAAALAGTAYCGAAG